MLPQILTSSSTALYDYFSCLKERMVQYNSMLNETELSRDNITLFDLNFLTTDLEYRSQGPVQHTLLLLLNSQTTHSRDDFLKTWKTFHVQHECKKSHEFLHSKFGIFEITRWIGDWTWQWKLYIHGNLDTICNHRDNFILDFVIILDVNQNSTFLEIWWTRPNEFGIYDRYTRKDDSVQLNQYFRIKPINRRYKTIKKVIQYHTRS